MNNQVGISVTVVVIALGALLMAWRKSRIPGAVSLMVMYLFIAVWSIVYLLPGIFPSTRMNPLWTAAIHLSSGVIAATQLIFVVLYTNRSHWITRPALILLGGLPVLIQLLPWVQPWYATFLSRSNPQTPSLAVINSWERINALYIYTLLGAGTLLLIDTVIRKPRPRSTQSWIVLASSILPLVAITLNVAGLDPMLPLSLLLLAFTLASLGFLYSLFNWRLMEISPVTREKVVEGMDDGWIVLDPYSNIVDINPAAEQMIGLSREKVHGQPIHTILSDFPNPGTAPDGIQELEMKRSVKSQEGWRYLNIRISSLTDPHKRQFGRLIVWRDITERRLAEDSRQRARDEMFVLLNAISSAASHAMNLDDFLSESIYQIIYPFRSQVVGIFLIDERNKKDEEPRLFLASHFGFPPEAINSMSYLPISSPLFDWVYKNRQPLLIENIQSDLRIPPAMREIDFSCLLAVPLMAQEGEGSKMLGCICVARKEKPVFSQDEVVRLSTVADQIATLIDSDRRRKLAIALSERQRLLRDLHDSVSQKLYGLVTLTEAAQAALEAGSSVNPSQVLSRIGENARQAVKEMRLFLYQMQPVDVEKEGLISVLHHRLAAVEGRADIKARLLADEGISLSKDKEIALYFIAQEALNNVLRHAHAKSVSVTLKQGRQNVILEILDDGRGFDPKKVERGGLGLRNMKERALQIDGRLKLISKPEQGTKIVVTVRKNRMTRSSGRRPSL